MNGYQLVCFVMKVAFFSPSWPPGTRPNGITTYCAAVQRCLEAASERPLILDMAGAVSEDADVVPVFAAPRGPLDRVCSKLAFAFWPERAQWNSRAQVLRATAKHIFKARGVELVEIEESFGWSKAITAAPSNERPAVAVRLHGPWFLVGPALGVQEDFAYRARVSRELEAIECADGVSAPSQFTLRAVEERLGHRLRISEVIPNPIFPPAKEHRWSAAGACQDRVLFVGRVDRVKGADVVLRAFGQIHKARPATRLVFAGPDAGYIDEAGRAMTQGELVSQTLVEPSRSAVEFLGAQTPAQVAELRPTAAVTIVASRYETFPYTLLESLNAGSPTVTSSGSGMSELFEEGVTAIGFPPGDHAALAQRVLDLLGDRGFAERLGRAAQHSVALRCGPEVVTPRLIRFYERVLASKNAMNR